MSEYSSKLPVIFVIALLVLVPISQTIPIPSIPPAYAEQLVPVTTSTTRSFSYPFLSFMGHSDSNLTTSLTWYANGTTHISDSRGNGFNFAVPILSGVTFTLLQNSTVVDQKVVGLTSSYDIYWNAVTNKNGIVQKYQLTITGSSVNGTTLQYPITSKENIVSDKNEFWATGASTYDYQSNDAIFRTLGGLGINWSDSIKQGYQVSFDQASSTLDITVGKSFLVDPTVVATGVPSSSPASGDYLEGERRAVNIGGNLFAFYYDSSNIVYRVSTDNGNTWGASTLVGAGTGQLAQDTNRWAVGSTTVSGTPYLSIVYWTTSGSNGLVHFIRGSVSSSTITWGAIGTLLTLPNNSPTACGGSICAAANEANDTSGNIFLTVRWLNATDSIYHHQEFKSIDGGNTFQSTDSAAYTGLDGRPEYVLARLSSGNMLLAQTDYTSTEFTYSVYSSTSGTWGASSSTSGAGMTISTFKEISAGSNGTNFAFVAYDAGNGRGALKVAKWTNSGTFSAFETADSTLSHALPSIAITRDNVIHIYSLNSSKIWETDKSGSTWLAPTNPFGTTFTSPDQLTAAIEYPAALWTEGTGPYTLKFGIDSVPGIPTALTATTAVSPSQVNLSWTAPQNNGAAVTGYKIQRSTDGGSTWTTIVSNTGSTATTYSDTGLTGSTTYTYSVSAINYIGAGSASNSASVTTPSGITLNGVNSASGTASASPYQITLSNFNVGTGTNRALVVGIEGYFSGVAASSVTFGGTTLTKALSSNTWHDTEFWYIANPIGTGNIVVTFPQATTAVVGAYAFYGVNQSSPVPTTTKGNNTCNNLGICTPKNPTISITTAYPNSWMLDSVSIAGFITLSSPTCTSQWNALTSDSKVTGVSSSQVATTTGTHACSWTASGNEFWDDVAAEIHAATGNVPTSPTGLTAAAASSSQINLSWTAPSNNGGHSIVGYEIDRSIDGGSTWSILNSNTNLYTTTYSDTGLGASTSYTYRVLAINSASNISYPSNSGSATTSSAASTGTASTGILEPLYMLPYSGTTFNWQPVITAHQAHPKVPFFVIVNPHNGPCEAPNGITDCIHPDPDYQKGIGNLANAGINVLGYVRTGHGHLTLTSTCCPYSVPKGNVTQWANMYKSSGVNGIFFDEMSTAANTGNLTYYGNLTNYAHGSFAFVFGNPGQDTSSQFLPTIDQMSIYEDANLPANTTALQGTNNWHIYNDKRYFSFISNGQPTDPGSAAIQGRSVYVNYLYATINCGAIAYSCIPTYLSSETSYLDNPSVLSTIKAQDASSNPLAVPVTITQSNNLVRDGTTPFSYNETSAWQFSLTAPSVSGYTFCKWTYGTSSTTTNPLPINPTQSTTYAITYAKTGNACPP